MILRYERGGARSTWGWTLFSSTSSARGRGCYCGEWKIIRRWSWGLSRKSDWIKNPKSGASAERAQTSSCNQHPDCVPWALPLWPLQSLPVGARCILIFLICNSSLYTRLMGISWPCYPRSSEENLYFDSCAACSKSRWQCQWHWMSITINTPLWYFKY